MHQTFSQRFLGVTSEAETISKSSAEISTPIGAVLELRSRANLPCLENLALKLNK